VGGSIVDGDKAIYFTRSEGDDPISGRTGTMEAKEGKSSLKPAQLLQNSRFRCAARLDVLKISGREQIS
jgi:hypothetical protein